MKKNTGFTLLELSISLVIIGLLVGGVLAGKNLIRAAQISAIMQEYKANVIAIGQFRQMYGQLPGDISTATNIWGTGSCTWTTGAVSTGKATCNGNGDGRLQFDYGGAVTSPTSKDEHLLMWQHLSNAGLLPGSYNARKGPYTLGETFPASKLSGAGWWMEYLYTSHWVAPFPDLDNSNWILLLRADNIEQWSGFHGASIITPQEAYDIDGKMDDGLPARGHVGLTSNSGTTDCMMKPDGSNVTAQTDTDAVYELTATGNNCYLIFVPEELDF